MNAPSRRLLDHVSPRERIDRRSPRSAQRVRRTDRRPLYPWAFGVICLFVAVMNHVRWTDKLVEIEEQHAIEIVAKIAVIASLLPPPPQCTDYRIHMERLTVQHCMKISKI